MIFVPRSLFGRNVLLLLTLYTINLFCGLVALREWVQKPHIAELADLVARQIRSVEAGLRALPTDQQRSFLRGLNAGGDLRAVSATSTVAPSRSMPPNLLAGLLEDALVERLAGGVPDLRWTRDGQTTLWVRMPLASEEYWLIVPRVQIDTHPVTTIELTILTALLSLVAAALIQRRINRPLVRLVQAANRIARGESVPHLSERAPQEIATLTRAFNQMSQGLAQIDAERTVMLAGVSHDLRTPLAKMRLAIEMLSRDGDPTLIDSMLRSAAEMDAIVDQFLEFARLASVDDRDRVDLNRLVRECAESYQVYGHGVQLDLQELPPVSAHAQSITRALDNLIGNALRYAGPPVLVQSRCLDGVVHVSVLDNGPGIDECEVESLKRPFTRGSYSSGISGAGLGLAIVERIARFHGGALALLRREGGGLHARIELPASSSPKGPGAARPDRGL